MRYKFRFTTRPVITDKFFRAALFSTFWKLSYWKQNIYNVISSVINYRKLEGGSIEEKACEFDISSRIGVSRGKFSVGS